MASKAPTVGEIRACLLSKGSARDALLNVMEPDKGYTLRRLNELTGRSVGSVRNLIQHLRNDGVVETRVSPGSKLAFYVKVSPLGVGDAGTVGRDAGSDGRTGRGSTGRNRRAGGRVK